MSKIKKNGGVCDPGFHTLHIYQTESVWWMQKYETQGHSHHHIIYIYTVASKTKRRNFKT